MAHMQKDRFPKREYNKLKWKKIGSCKILRKFSSKAYEIELPKNVGISPIFNVSDLYPFHIGEYNLSTTQEEDDQEIQWEVQLSKTKPTVPEQILEK